jgi:hypothetical protein
MPKVCQRDIGAVQTFRDEQRKALKLRRGGLPFEASGAKEEKTDKDVERYPEVRGLRFCTERRLYLDRDRESAVAIARLRTLELLGKLRPAPFHRSFKIATTNSNQLAKQPFSRPASKTTAIVLKEAEPPGSGGQDRDVDHYVMSVDPSDPFGACVVGLQNAHAHTECTH